MQKNRAPLIDRIVTSPWADRLGAVVFTAIVIHLLLRKPSAFTVFYVLFFIASLQASFNTLFRWPAKRVETNKWVLLISLLRLYWPTVILYFAEPTGEHLINLYAAYWIACLILALIIYSRWSLGRSLGCFPADRKLVVTGAYGVIRHPIQTLEVLFFINLLLARFNLRTTILVALGAIIFVLKSLAEEQFHSKDEEYRRYKELVPWRFIPFVV